MRETRSFRPLALVILALVAAVASPSQLQAQQDAVPAVGQSSAAVATAPSTAAIAAPSTAPIAASSAVTLAGPRIQEARFTRDAAEPKMAPMRDEGISRNVVWMIVGGATLVVGSVVGGDAGTIMMVTGGVIGLVGLMRFLQ